MRAQCFQGVRERVFVFVCLCMCMCCDRIRAIGPHENAVEPVCVCTSKRDRRLHIRDLDMAAPIFVSRVYVCRALDRNTAA